MTKSELIEALKPFSDELVIDVAMGPLCRGAWKAKYELANGEGHLVLCADSLAEEYVNSRMNYPDKTQPRT